MRIFIIISLLLSVVFTSCEDSQHEVIDISDITGESERYKEGETAVTEEQVVIDTTLVAKSWFVNQGVDITSLEYRSDRMFPDRFGATSIEKYTLFSLTDTVLYSKWVYVDSVKVMNAFTNWTNCFGDNCKTIFFGDDKNFQRNPMQVLMNDTCLIFIEGNQSVDFKLWNEFHDVENKKEPWNFVIEQPRWSKARWYNFPDGKRTKLEL